jgi:hypothetical protein
MTTKPGDWLVPSGALAAAAMARISQAPMHIADHSRRSWLLARAFAEQERLDVDLEVVHAGLMLHDLGLVEPHPVRGVRFEIVGAEAVRALALEHGLSRVRADNAWDVVALHAESLADYKSPETALAARGISADVSGRGLDTLRPEIQDDIFRTRPGFAGLFIESLVSFARSDPAGASYCWVQPVVERHLPQQAWPDLEARARAHPYERPPTDTVGS